MAEKKYYWLKLPRNFFGKHYIKILRAKENGELLVLFYMWMLTEAIDHEGRLRYSEDIPYDEEMLAEASGFALHIVTQALQQFTKLQLVITESDGTLFMPKSIEMIGSESASEMVYSGRSLSKIDWVVSLFPPFLFSFSNSFSNSFSMLLF